MDKLNEQSLSAALRNLPGWQLGNGELEREFRFQNFVQAIEFVKKVANLAEAEGHHPDIDIRYNRVRLALVTHDSGGITAKDTDLAAQIAQISPEE